MRERLRYVAGAAFEPASEFVLRLALRAARCRHCARWAAPSFAPGRPLAEAAIDLMARIHADFAYRSASTDIDTPLAEVLARARACARTSRT